MFMCLENQQNLFKNSVVYMCIISPIEPIIVACSKVLGIQRFLSNLHIKG